MGVKFELLLALLIVAIVTVMLNIELKPPKQAKAKSMKELEFYQTRFTEVTTQKVVGVAFSEHGVRQNGVLHVEGLFYRNDNIKVLKAMVGIDYRSRIVLEGNVTLEERNGYTFQGERAVYEKKSGMFHIASPFLMQKGTDRFSGKSLTYDTVGKVLHAKEVHALLTTALQAEQQQ